MIPSRLASRALVGAFLLAVVVLFAGRADSQAPPGPTLVGRAVLSADTFAEGPPSGRSIDPTSQLNGRTIPFPRQPVQGVSAVLDNGDGTFLVMSDNGYGNKANSPDYNLRVHTVRPAFRTASGGGGTVEVLRFFQLRDPDRVVPFPIVNGATAERVLTGGDFDIESFRRTADGSFWFGDEFGPFLLHTDATGKVLDGPYRLPLPPNLEFAFISAGEDAVRSPEHPEFVGLADQNARNAAANLPSSRGFEGMALSADGTRLYPLLEGALRADPDRARLLISEFDIARRAYTGRVLYYRMESETHAIGDMTAINESEFLVIERDGGEGTAARFKKVYLVDFAQTNAGFVRKTELVDLLRLADPGGISGQDANAVGLGNPFSFPFTTIESVLMLDPSTMLIINDNNYPFSAGRRPRTPDDNEFILIRLPAPLDIRALR